MKIYLYALNSVKLYINLKISPKKKQINSAIVVFLSGSILCILRTLKLFRNNDASQR